MGRSARTGPRAADGRGRRRHPRVALRPPLALTVRAAARVVPAELVNISRSGSAILAAEPLGDPGTRLVLDVPERASPERAPVPCEVRWVLAERDPLPRRWLHGAEFAPLADRARDLVDRVIAAADAAPPDRR